MYEFTHHERVGKGAGLTDAEIARLTTGADAPGWTPFEAALIRAADQLHAQSGIDDTVWRTLAERYDEAQMMDVVVTAGQYNLVSWYLNALGTPLEPGLKPYPMRGK